MKSSDDLKRERELLSELLELVQKRSFIVDSLEEERVRYLFVSSLHFSQKTARLSSSLTSCLDLNNDKLMSEMKPWLMRAAEIQI